MASYENECPITREEINGESSYLVRVPQKEKGKYTYYYIGDEDTLNRLNSCPLTRYEGDYEAVPLSKLSKDQLEFLQDENESKSNKLVDANDQLQTRQELQLFDQFPWEKKSFGQKKDEVKTFAEQQQQIRDDQRVACRLHDEVNGTSYYSDSIEGDDYIGSEQQVEDDNELAMQLQAEEIAAFLIESIQRQQALIMMAYMLAYAQQVFQQMQMAAVSVVAITSVCYVAENRYNFFETSGEPEPTFATCRDEFNHEFEQSDDEVFSNRPTFVHS